jgi:hypothetical protein
LASTRPHAAQSLPLPPHPRLLLNAEGVVQLKQRIETAPWAKESWAELKAEAERSLKREVELPPRGGNWSHNYVCPTHGARLSQGKKIGPWQWEHICPVGNHILRGDPSRASRDFDGNAISGIHSAYGEEAVNCGLLYQVTGEERYARRGREILMAYAARYLDYPLHDNQGNSGKGARMASQSLTEASWLIQIAQGTDLIWNTLSESDRATIADKLLRPSLEQVILPRRMGIHNIQCRQNSAIGLVGFLLDDKELIARAIDDLATGFRQQIAKGVLGDGMWLEGSSGYHFFTVQGLWPLAEAARNCGIDLYDAKLRCMFDGPLRLAMPNLVLPNFNDSGTVALRGQADLYEVAFARFHNPAYVPLLKEGGRSGRLALLFGSEDLPTPDVVASSGSRNSEGSGYAILQRGSGADSTWLCLKYGPHGGGHGHPDKNSFVLYARGKILATDAGTHAYGSSLHRDWDKTTLAHNTLIVDETSQASASGKCLAFGSEQGVDYAITEAGPIYNGVKFTRTAAMLTPDLVLFVDQIEADAPHTFDIAYHQIGEWEAKGPTFSSSNELKPWKAPPAVGYSHVTQAFTRTVNTNELILASVAASDWHPAIAVLGNEPTEVIKGYGILKTTEDLAPILIQRRRAKSSAFVWAISVDGSPVTLRAFDVKDENGIVLPQAKALLVQALAKGKSWSVLVNPQRVPVSASPAGTPPTRSTAIIGIWL